MLEALGLLGQASVRAIALRSVLISGLATLLAIVAGLPLGYALARSRFPGRTALLGAIHAAMGFPPVVVGLVVWMLLVRSGPLGALELVYTPQAMVAAQFLISLPIVTGLTAAAIQSRPPELYDLLAVLGAGRLRRIVIAAREARLGLIAAILAAFGGVLSEVGASMTVGGNLERSTRVLTTAIVTATSRGETGRALALGLILLLLSLAVSLVLTRLQQDRSR